ncbi:polyprenyl synthetase family protein [Streptomyces sp. JV185]|uniref:polyprenyl synthetase family protein n=1 Tax=Streptomyces sp. JV185 TaxID=858638 RepID=UPI002E76B677|nr:polyprenyl synthetase family protein [Streptomyces sp. JV185]MEE1770098.1 polyprenyl synthetase family protein [Streptomyces sp. JV185]
MLGLRPAVAEPARSADDPLVFRDVVRAVEVELGRILDEILCRARETDPVFAREVAERVSAFVRRGGKRLRTAFVWCGWRAAGGAGGIATVVSTGAALELVQACALIHDDVMDGSSLRRGAPAMHVEFARMHLAAQMNGPSRAFASSTAVLAGDLALAWADDLLTEAALGSPYGIRLHREWQSMRTEMVAGQYRDLRAQATGSSGIEEALAIATLKSALYTVERPLALGAALSGADASLTKTLRSAGRCAGLAFQLRDDLLGAFGDPDLTGKPADDDLRTRKLTYLLAVGRSLADASGDEAAADTLKPGTAPLSDDAVRRMRTVLERTGARAVVEAKISELAAASLRHFDRTGAEPLVGREFAALVERVSGPTPKCAGGPV